MSNIKQLEERIAQVTELIKSGSKAIESMKVALEAAEEERDRLADQRREQEPKFERVKDREAYWSVDSKFCAEGKATPCQHYENFHRSDNSYFDNNNYFKTEQRAKEVADKINRLLKLERLHDIYCPDYKPDWESADDKHYVIRDEQRKKYVYRSTIGWSEVACVFFPTKKIAQKVCNILNEELDS